MTISSFLLNKSQGNFHWRDRSEPGSLYILYSCSVGYCSKPVSSPETSFLTVCKYSQSNGGKNQGLAKRQNGDMLILHIAQ